MVAGRCVRLELAPVVLAERVAAVVVVAVAEVHIRTPQAAWQAETVERAATVETHAASFEPTSDLVFPLDGRL